MTSIANTFVKRIATPTLILMSAAAAQATVGPPVKITLDRGGLTAASGAEYAGTFEVHVGLPGTLTDLAIKGEGWRLVSAELPGPSVFAPAGVLRIPFRAVPTDADQAIGLSFRYDGRPVRRSFKVGPAQAARAAQRGLLRRVDLPGHAVGPAAVEAVPPELGPVEGGARGGAIPLRFKGWFYYERNDGRLVGADHIRVRVRDDDGDLIGSELIWEGQTDHNGRFDSGDISWDDCDGTGCDAPDIFIIIECDTSIAQVQESDLEEVDYYWHSRDNPIDDFGGGEVDFGQLAPGDGDDGAVHIWNSIIRAHRYIQDHSGINLPSVDVQWPESEDGAWYNWVFEEIHIGPSHTWRDGTHTHEYGHHFLENRAVNPAADYCNGYCDGEGSCDFDTDCPDEGHCAWCPETDHDAFNEGWPNWLGHVVPRDYPNHYVFFDDGSVYQPVNPTDFEVPEICCVDGLEHDRTLVEGFVAALLVDIHDNEQDDHDDDPDPDLTSYDGIGDMLCLGPEEILYVTDVHDPVTVHDFLAAFRSEYPQHTGRLWSTAYNVSLGYIAGFPPDTQPPGVVAYCESSSHPQGVGGSLPCITIEFDAAPDDATGASRYSAVATQNPAGEDPGENLSAVSGTNDCRLTTVVPTRGLGDWYISIKARDNGGTWSGAWSTFGPFTVLDCNDTGFLDVCDIDCNSQGIPGCQVGGLCLSAQGSCGTSPDCNVNFIPDECDLSSGASEDCNRDGTPDECQTAIIKHFKGANTDAFGVSQWELTENWEEGALPVDGDHVCIPSGTPASECSFSEDVRWLTTLNCDTDFSIDGSSPELRIDQPSYVSGDLTLAVTSTLRSMTSLDVGGQLEWRGLEILGPGTVNVYGGFDLASPVARPKLRSSAHLSILDGDVNIHGDEYFELQDTSTFSIGLPVTYTYDGNFNIFSGATTTIVNVAGSLIRNSGTLNATIGSFVLNSGLIHNRTGDLTLSHGGTHSGFVLGDPGTLLRLSRSHDFLASSSLAGDDITFGSTSLSSTSFVRGELNVADVLLNAGGTCTITNQADVASYGQHLIVLAGSARLEAPSNDPLVTVDAVTVGDLTTEGSKDVRFNTGQPVSLNTLSLVKGDIHGADAMTINESFVWGTGGGTILSGGAITCNAPSTIQGNASSRSLNRAFNNAAYATFLGAFGGSGPFNNLATGTVELRGNSTGISTGTTTNAGLIVKTQGTGSASSLNGLSNSGEVRAEVGETYFSGGGTNSGDIIGLTGTLLSFINGSHEMTPVSSLSADDIRFSNFTANIRGDVDIADTLTMHGGTCTFTNEANVTSYGQHVSVLQGSVRFEAPVIGSGAAFDVVTVGDLVTEGGKDARFNTGQPVSINTLSLVKGDINGPDPITVNDAFVWGTGGGSINAGGAITCNGPATIQGGSSARNLSRVFNNAAYATFLGGFSGGGGGSFNNLATGTIDLRNTGNAIGLGTNATLSNHGLLVKSAGTGVSDIFTHFHNTGTVEVQVGTFELNGFYGFTHIQTAGETILNGGSLRVTNNTPYQIQGGDLTGYGAITAAVTNSGGTVRPGLSAGQLSITGNYTQSAGGALEIEIGGLVPGVSHDRLAVSGTATLAGTLRVGLIGGYIPAIGEQYVILTAAGRTGTFVAVESLTPGLTVNVSYTPTTVLVEIASLGVPAATVTGAALRKPNPAEQGGFCDLPVDLAAGLPITTEPRNGGITELRIAFDVPPGNGGADPVSIEEAVCPSPPAYAPYAGASTSSATVMGNELVLTFSPALENARTYRLTLGSEVTSIPDQTIEIRGLIGDANHNGLVNGNDRSVVIGMWTAPGSFSCGTDLNSSGATNGNDRSIVIGAWTGTGTNCAP